MMGMDGFPVTISAEGRAAHTDTLVAVLGAIPQPVLAVGTDDRIVAANGLGFALFDRRRADGRYRGAGELGRARAGRASVRGDD